MKKSVWLFVVLAILCVIGSAAAQGIGSPESPVKVTYLCKDVVPTEEPVIQLIDQVEAAMAKMGNYVDIEVLEAPAGKYADVVPIAFRTEQINPDIIYFQGGDLPISQEGLLEDLTDFIAGSENVQALMGDHNRAAIKSYPYLLWLAPGRVQIPVIRKDHFEQLDSAKKVVEDPTTENYYAMFKEMKEKGLCDYAITTDGGIIKLDNIFNHAFGVTATIVKDGENWVYATATEAEKNKLEFYAKLYAEGLLDNEYVTKQWDTMEQAFYEGKSCMVAGTAGDVVNVYNNKMIQTNGDATELIALPPAKGISQAYKSLDVSKEPRGFAINAYSEVKDAAWAVLDFMASPEGRIFDKLGLRDIHYTIDGDRYVLTDKFPEWWARFWPTMNGLDLSKVDGEVLTAPALDSLAKADQYFAADVNVILPEDLLPLKDAMDMLYTEYSTDIIRGVRPIEDFDEFIAKWNEAGGRQITEYLNSVLN